MKQPFAVDPTAHSTQDTLITAKFAVPPPAPVDAVRTRLIGRIDNAHASSVIAITGPPGSGKTTLAAHWTRIGVLPGPVSWLTLDEDDNTPATFWAYLIHAIRTHCPGLVLDLPVPGRAGPVDAATLMHVAAAVGARATPVTVVLDRTELLTDRGIATQLESLLRYAAPGLRLLVVGRNCPLLPLHRYRLTGELTEINADDLALTAEETSDVVGSHGVHLSAEEINALHAATEGWVTAVSLQALALRADRDTRTVPHPAGQHAVTDFLRSEVLDTQPPRVRNLLLRTSILDRVDP